MNDNATCYYTIPEFLSLYPMGRSSFYRIVKGGDLRITKFGRSTRILATDAMAWAKGLPTLGGTAGHA